MKICNQYNHHKGLEKIQSKNGILKEIRTILNHGNLSFGADSSKEIKAKINERFNQKGWADKVKVGNSNLTISCRIAQHR